MANQFSDLIRETRRRFGDAPRSFGFFERRYQKIKPPWWARLSRDALLANYAGQRRLMEEGRIAWGVVVQANQLMFQAGKQDCPGTVIYSPDERWSDALEPLARIAPNLFELKGAGVDDPEAQRYGDMLADEMDRAMGLAVPSSLTGGRRVISTSLVFHRKHLPGRRLSGGFFPLLYHPHDVATMLLPLRYWAPDLLQFWRP